MSRLWSRFVLQKHNKTPENSPLPANLPVTRWACSFAACQRSAVRWLDAASGRPTIERAEMPGDANAKIKVTTHGLGCYLLETMRASKPIKLTCA